MPAHARQTADPEAQEPEGAPTANVEDGVPEGRGRVYEPAFFTQFAPRNAFDMLDNVPGFSISRNESSNQRGLGQATQNVLINGERLSSKADGAEAQLSRIPADNVVRIEIVDGTTLDIPGLTGQVANIVVRGSNAGGQFEWEGGSYFYNSGIEWIGGTISLTGSSGRLDYTVALSNENDRFGSDGPTVIFDGAGAIIESQNLVRAGEFDNPELSTNFRYDFGGDTVGSLNLSYKYDRLEIIENETGIPMAGPVRSRNFRLFREGPEYEINAELEFPLGPGRMKLIGLESFDDTFRSFRIVDSFEGEGPDVGNLFTRQTDEHERIGRFEYGWGMWGADWQLSGEAAFNSLDQIARLSILEADGEFVEIPFDGGTGGVTEDRYEGILSFSKQLTDALAFQATGGMEFSKLQQTGSDANSRSFQRAKGSVSLAWKPEPEFDMSLELRRRIGQLSFSDFLADVSLDDDNESAANNSLVPSQNWELTFEMNRDLGRWGSFKFEAGQFWIEDYIDLIPVGVNSEANGNIDGTAKRTRTAVITTFNLDPLGLAGARLDIFAAKSWTELDDPFTGLKRGFSSFRDERIDAEFRHDIPNTDWTYGAQIEYFHITPYFRRAEVGREWEGPTFGEVFVEHKDVLGLTVRATLNNILNGRQRLERTVYDGLRTEAPIRFVESRDRRIGPIFRLSVSGNF